MIEVHVATYHAIENEDQGDHSIAHLFDEMF